MLLLGLAVLLGLSKSIWSSEYIAISFRSKASESVSYQLFYTLSPQESFSEENSIKTIVNGGDEMVTVKLYKKYLHCFRIDVDPAATAEAEVCVSDISVQGKNVFTGNNLSKLCNFNASQQFSVGEQEVKVKARRGVDAYMVFSSPLSIHSAIHVDWLVLSSVVVLGILVIYKFASFVLRFKLLNEGRHRDIIFLLVFFLLLFIPASSISDAEKSEKENRMLAGKPSIDKLFDTGYQYGGKFDSWFSDRFYGRDALVNLHRLIGWGVSKKGNSLVLCGKDNWLFYKGDYNPQDYMNIHPASEEQLQRAAQFVADMKQWCSANNKKFYYFIAPNKHKVYAEYYKGVYKQKPDSESMVFKFLHELKQKGISAIYPLEELKKAKKDGLMYWRHDTHWTTEGAYVGYKALMEELSKEHPEVEMFEPVFRPAQDYCRDLEGMYLDARKDSLEGYKEFVPKTKVSVSGPPVGQRGISVVENQSRKGYVVVLRDSFTTNLAPYLNETFGTVCYIWRWNISQEEVDKYLMPADIIILETVERFAPVLSDCKFPK